MPVALLKLAICSASAVAVAPYGSPEFTSFTHPVMSAVGSAPSGAGKPAAPPAASRFSTLDLATPIGSVLSGSSWTA
jgi:hypothetical protein